MKRYALTFARWSDKCWTMGLSQNFLICLLHASYFRRLTFAFNNRKLLTIYIIIAASRKMLISIYFRQRSCSSSSSRVSTKFLIWKHRNNALNVFWTDVHSRHSRENKGSLLSSCLWSMVGCFLLLWLYGDNSCMSMGISSSSVYPCCFRRVYVYELSVVLFVSTADRSVQGWFLVVSFVFPWDIYIFPLFVLFLSICFSSYYWYLFVSDTLGVNVKRNVGSPLFYPVNIQLRLGIVLYPYTHTHTHT